MRTPNVIELAQAYAWLAQAIGFAFLAYAVLRARRGN